MSWEICTDAFVRIKDACDVLANEWKALTPDERGQASKIIGNLLATVGKET